MALPLTHINTPEVVVLSSLMIGLLVGTAQAERLPAGTPIDGAISVDVTEHGLDMVTALAPILIPEELPLEATGDEYPGLFEQCWLGGVGYEVSNLTVYLDIVDIEITPGNDVLDVSMELDVQINEISNPFELWTTLECIESTCDGRVEPFNVFVDTTIGLEMTEPLTPDGERQLVATIEAPSIDYDLSGDAVHLSDCTWGTILDVLDFFGLDVIDLILPSLDGVLQDTVAEMTPELESMVEDAFTQLVIDEEFEVLDASLRIVAEPDDIKIKPSGIRLSLAAMADAGEAAPCVADYDPGGSEYTPSNRPAVGFSPPDINPGFVAAALLSDDFGNQALYALWRSGLLCYTVDEDLGFAIDTSVLGLLAGETFNDLFPSPRPMVIETRPQEAPTLVFNGDNDLGIAVSKLGLDFVAELDYRQARVLSLDLDVDAGANIDFDGTIGELAVGIDLTSDSFIASVSDNQFVPGASANIESSFAGVFSSLIGGLLGDTLEGFTFYLPSFEGLGLSRIELTAVGPAEDWLGAYVWAGPVAYEGAGCSGGGDAGCGMGGGDAGCDIGGGDAGCGGSGDSGLVDTGTGGGGDCASAGSGCGGGSGGCASTRSQRRWGLLMIPLAFIALRRKE